MHQHSNRQSQSFIDWEPPSPKNGMDTFIGPGATMAELVLQFGGAFITACLLYWHSIGQHAQEREEITAFAKIGTFLLAMDMAGGVVTNSTSAAKRWYHRSSQTVKDHLGFVAIHALQIGLVARQCDVTDNSGNTVSAFCYFGLVYGYILISSMIILAVPLYLQRPTSMWLTTLSIPLTLALHSPRGLEWFIPLLSIKLLVSHLPKEAPFQPDDNNTKDD